MHLVGRTATVIAARQAAGLFAVCGVMTLVAVPTEPTRPVELALVGLADLVIAFVIVLLPWSRWRLPATLWIIGPAVAVIAAAHALEVLPVRSYGVFFVLLFAWVGVHQQPYTALKLAPVITVAYVVPLVATDAQPPLDPRAVLVAITVGIVVAETIARSAAESERTRSRADRSARTFATVGQATSTLVESDAPAVLDTVVDTVMALGYDGVNLAVIDATAETFTSGHARGLMLAFNRRSFSTASGLTGQVVRTMAPVVIEDYQQSEYSIAALRSMGVRTTIGVPVVSNGTLVAVLIAAYARVATVEPEDIEALRIISAHAGAALTMVNRLNTEQVRAANHEQASLTDELTGIGNRRRGQELLDQLEFGDAVAIIDVDHFKHVNDTLGHAAGDELLIRLAEFLTTSVRGRDHIVRWGGEEFLVILPSTSLDGAVQLVDRLRVTWEATAPITTFSAGTAAARPNESAAAAVARADSALYDAKAGGRNRVSG